MLREKYGTSVSNAASSDQRMGQQSQHSSAKLPQVMIGVQISPSHPILRGHCPEYRMRHAGRWQSIAEPVQGREQRSKILAEINWRRTAFALFHLRAGGKSLGPRQGYVQSNHLTSVRCRKPVAGLAYFSPSATLVGVIQMAHHLVDRHAAPARRVVRRQLATMRSDIFCRSAGCLSFSRHLALTR